MTVINGRIVKPIHCYEQLDTIEKEKDEPLKLKLIKEYGSRPPLNFILSLNFNNSVKLDLPEGMPPIDAKKLDMLTHPDFMGQLGSTIARLKHCTVDSDLKKFKKEQIFYEVLINCPLKDAEILCSAKDKALTELYPSVTAELVSKVFPNYVKA